MPQLSLSIESSLLVRDVAGEYRPANADEAATAQRSVRNCAGEVLTPQAVRPAGQAGCAGARGVGADARCAEPPDRICRLFRARYQASVYPREVVKESLALNAAAAIFCHNHPSGVAEPSRADEVLTSTLKTALSLVDVRVLDHLIVAGNDVMSFAERGLL
jgi:DNA repair protein RadC